MASNKQQSDSANSRPAMQGADQQAADRQGADLQTYVLVGIAVVLVLVYFAVLIYLLLAELGSNPDRWRRAVQLMQALGAVALTAAGFLFGREVNRKRAENAEERAESVKIVPSVV